MVNAFSIPGGYIYVSSALFDFVQSESELAAVLGHEIGHVVAGHASNRIARVSLITVLFDQAREIGLIPDDAMAQKLADAAMPLLFEVDARTFYSRDDETEADLLALYELVRAGWEPEGEISLLTRLANASPEQSALLALIATHPSPSDRLSIVREECRIANFPTGLKRDSAEFKAMHSATHGTEDRMPWLWQYILPVSAALGCAACVCIFLYLRKRR
jgi:predicted Zn-dependent protease